MATNTYTALLTQTLSTAVSSVTFNSIPQGYTDLELVANIPGTANGEFFFEFNGDTATNYSRTYLYGNGTSAVLARQSSRTSMSLGYTGVSGQVMMKVSLLNYSNTSTYKTCISRFSNAKELVIATVGLWRKTPEAINQIKITSSSSTFAIGSTFTIYAIKSE